MEIYAETAMGILDELHTERLDYHSEYVPLADAIDRLAAYEDTGLSPEEIRDSIGGISPICVQCDGKTSDGVVTEKCGYPDDITKCLEQSKHLCELAQAEKEGRLVVLPRLHGKKLLRDGLEFEPNHWNITLTAFAHNQPTKSGKRVGLFSICEAAEAALEEREDKPCKS